MLRFLLPAFAKPSFRRHVHLPTGPMSRWALWGIMTHRAIVERGRVDRCSPHWHGPAPSSVLFIDHGLYSNPQSHPMANTVVALGQFYELRKCIVWLVWRHVGTLNLGWWTPSLLGQHFCFSMLVRNSSPTVSNNQTIMFENGDCLGNTTSSDGETQILLPFLKLSLALFFPRWSCNI